MRVDHRFLACVLPAAVSTACAIDIDGGAAHAILAFFFADFLGKPIWPRAAVTAVVIARPAGGVIVSLLKTRGLRMSG